MKLRVDKECSLRIITYSDNLDQRGRWFVLKADRTYEIYYRGKAASVAGGLNVGTSISAATNIGQKVTIEDLIVTLNNYDAWCDAESRATLKTSTRTPSPWTRAGRGISSRSRRRATSQGTPSMS